MRIDQREKLARANVKRAVRCLGITGVLEEMRAQFYYDTRIGVALRRAQRSILRSTGATQQEIKALTGGR